MSTVQITAFDIDAAMLPEAAHHLQHTLQSSTHPFMLIRAESEPAQIHVLYERALPLEITSLAAGQPSRITFHCSPWQPGETASANVVEMVQNYFPSSRVTSQFQEDVQAAFLQFNETFLSQAVGNIGCSYGWMEGEVKHVGVSEEKARCFVLVRGWRSRDDFKSSTETEAYKKAIPLLLRLEAAAYTMV